jgi:hypothetical protein
MKSITPLYQRPSLTGIIALGWLSITTVFFATQNSSVQIPPIAEGALSSLLLAYFPVLLLCVFLLLFLTRGRASFDWASLYRIDPDKAAGEVFFAFAYLALTQLLLGAVFSIGLHFPGPDVYELGIFEWTDVALWMAANSFFYIVIPLYWLRRQGLIVGELMRSLQWRNNIWILIAFWALDFFGPIISGVPFFELSAEQYAIGVPVSIAVNTFGAGLPVVILMHVVLIPRLMLMYDSKVTVIAIAGVFYAVFSFFDSGVDYSSVQMTLLSVTYILMTQMLVGMGKATFTVVTGNPFIHFATLHILSARIPFDTAMYAEIF